MTISIINEKPLVFASADPAYPKLARILREQLCGLDPKPFSFKLAEGYAAMERYRFVYPAKHILFNLETREAIKYFASEKVPQFLRELRRKVNDVDYVVKGISRLR